MSRLGEVSPSHLSMSVSMSMDIEGVHGEAHQHRVEEPGIYVSTPLHSLASLGLNYKGMNMRELMEVLQRVNQLLETKNQDVDTQQVSPSMPMDILQPFISTLSRLPKVEPSPTPPKNEIVEPLVVEPIASQAQAPHHKPQKITTNFLKPGPGSRRRSKSHTGLEGTKCENCDFWFSLALALLQLLQFQLGDKNGLFGNSVPSQQTTPQPPSQQQSPYQGEQEDFTLLSYRSHHRAHSGPSEPNTPNPRRTFHSIYPIANSNEFNSFYNSPKSAPISPKVETTPINPLSDLHLLEAINDHDKELETITLSKSGNELFTSLVRESCFAPEPFQMLIGTSDSSTKIETPIAQFTNETPVSGNFQTPVPRSLSSNHKFVDYPSPFEATSKNTTDTIPRYSFEVHHDYPNSAQRSPQDESPSRLGLATPNPKPEHPFPICATSPFREFINQSAFYANGSAQHLSPLARDKDKENLD
eukprot:TRINITY_DN14282_c0_g1_i2.p1 TRINITY_DN14282_c0_g1~~TRINITY_DN14282_c0_g1_i2.p1  ORF type:complete len:472 (+),score=87.28 TRINITY_DN14282_c0_g1_i2:239-1654(+)